MANVEIWARHDLHGERSSRIIRSGKGWECSVPKRRYSVQFVYVRYVPRGACGAIAGPPGNPPRPRRVPHPSPPSVHRQALGGPHTGTRHRVGTGGRRHRHRERPTRVPATRAAADPKPSPVPILSRLVNAALRTQVSGCHGQRTQAISQNLPPRDAEVGGRASRDRRGPARADDARRQPLGRKKAGESGSRIIPILP